MKRLLPALLLTIAPSCAALDKSLGIGSGEAPDRTEETIQAGESVIRSAGDIVLPGVGGAAALAFGLAARAYVRKRKAKTA